MINTSAIASTCDTATHALDSDVQLAARLQAGEPSAFEALVQTYGGRMLIVARRILGCEAESADAVQDAFLSAFQSFDTFRGDSQIGTWLHRITVNCCLMRLRSMKRRTTVRIDDLLPNFDKMGHHAFPVAPWQRSPHDVCCDTELCRQVRRSIDQLPDNHREILLLRDIDGLDTVEAASLLGMSESVVKTRLHRGRQALRTLLEPMFTQRCG